MNRRLFLALILVVATIGISLAIYFVFFRPPALPTPAPPLPTPPITGLPPIAPGIPPGVTPPPPAVLPEATPIAQGGPTQTTALTERTVRGAALTGDGQSMAFYNPSDNFFYRLSPDGSVSKLSDRAFFGVQQIYWSPDASRAVLEYPDGSNIFFDFDRHEQVTLPKHWQEFDFSNNGQQIVAKSMGVNVNNRWLIVSQADGSEARTIEALGENANRVTVSWSPSNEVIAFSATGEPLGFDTTEIIPIGQNQENLKALIVEGRDFRPLWSADGNRLLYSVYHSSNGYRPMLWLTDARGDRLGENRQSLGLETWADKCVFASASVAYCAVPASLPEGAGFQPAVAVNTPDQVYRLDISQGTKTLVGLPAEGSAMTNLSVSSDERLLFYTEAGTGILRKMQLR
ncbi:PD40 domain-containing protein [Candidatus Uhrbacteria bacterium]|nr:PD40 domain-containing protein [Candidatus Uhrbacteria bacterium]